MAVIVVSQVVQSPATDFLQSQLDQIGVGAGNNLLRPPAGGTYEPFATNFITQIGKVAGVVGLEDYTSILADKTAGAPIVNNLPITIPTQQLKVVIEPPSLADDFLDRIYMIPEELDVGAVVSDAQRSFIVFNAHRRNSQHLKSITPFQDDGIVLTEPAGKAAPTSYCPSEQRTYTLDISAVGPTTIAATFTFDWPPGSTPGIPAGTSVFTLLGFRIVLFPFPPTWRSPLVERIEYSTDVLLSDNATEQRARLRKFPRKFYEFEASAFPGGGLTLEQASQKFDSLIWGFGARQFAVPVWTDCLILNAGTTAGQTVLAVDPVGKDFFVGGLGVVYKNIEEFETFNIVSAPDGGPITLTGGLQDTIAGPVRIYPVHTARIDTAQETLRPFDQFVFGGFTFAVDDNHEDPTPADPATTFKVDSEATPLPVLQDQPERSNDLTHEFQRKAFVLDYKFGPKATDDNIGSPIEIKSFRWAFGDRALFSTWKAMIQSRAGRLKPIWVPSWHSDLEIVLPVGDLDTTITIRDIGYRTFYQNQAGRNAMQILLKDNTRVYVGLVTSSAAGAPGEEILTLDTAVGSAIPVLGDIAKVSFMGLYRMEADLFEIAWESANNPIIEVRMRLLVADTNNAVN